MSNDYRNKDLNHTIELLRKNPNDREITDLIEISAYLQDIQFLK